MSGSSTTFRRSSTDGYGASHAGINESLGAAILKRELALCFSDPHRGALQMGSLRSMSHIGDSMFRQGQAVWVIEPDGSQRAAEYVGEGELSAWFGGSPTVIVVYLDTRSGEAVEVDRVIAREEE